VKEQYRLTVFFRLERMASWPGHEREGPGAAYPRLFLGAGWGGRLPLESLLWGRASTEATYPEVQMHWFRKQPPIVRTIVGFVVIATVLCLFFGPIGILYALGFEALYLLTIAFAAILDPDVY
jgi:hypothetical protein